MDCLFFCERDAVLDIDDLKHQILHNCNVTDAQHAGIYSVCGLVMRLRDLYKWEHRLQPWQDDEPGKVLDWIGEKEELWETLMTASFETIRCNGQRHDAFDTASINTLIEPNDLYYGAGYAHSLKPTFFLADIQHSDTISGHTIVTTGREHARDLLTLPAFSQNGHVVLRTEAAKMFLWDQILYLGQSGRRALEYAAAACGLPDASNASLRKDFERIWTVQKSIYVRHEIGELEESVFDRAAWRQILAEYPHSAVELLVRSLKDILADTGPNGVLAHICEHFNNAGLGLYLAFGNGIHRMLTKSLICAFDAFLKDHQWQRIQDAAETIRQEAADYARMVIDLYREAEAQGDLVSGRAAIEATMVQKGLMSKP